MRSLQLIEFGAPLEWRELPTPEPQGREVLLETVATGVCHSDLHLQEGFYELGGGKRIYVKDRGVRLPLTLGHEVVGQVVATGPDVTDVELGAIRLVYPWIGCDRCKHCRADRPQMCALPRSLGIFSHGGYSDYLIVPDARFLLDIDGLAPETACSYACAGVSAFSAVGKTLPLDDDEWLLLIGAGGLGLMAAQVVESMTGARVIMVDVDDRKLETARHYGAFSTINSKSTDAKAEILDRTEGRGVAGAVDFVGIGATASLGYEVLAKNATLVLVGLFGGELTLSVPHLPLKNITIRGSYTGSLTELRQLIEVIRARGFKPLPVTCHPMEAVPRLLDDIRAGRVVGRAVVRPGGGSESDNP
jgi:alcohol dehydrogenase, propanol-preferring